MTAYALLPTDTSPFDRTRIPALFNARDNFRMPAVTAEWMFPTNVALLRAITAIGGPCLAVIDPNHPLPPAPFKALEHESNLYATPVYCHLLVGGIQIGQREYQGIFVVYGDSLAFRGIAALWGKNALITPAPTVAGLLQQLPAPRNITAFSTIQTPVAIAYQLGERGLYHLLKNRSISVESRIMSAIVSLYPHTRPLIANRVTITVISEEEEGGGAFDLGPTGGIIQAYDGEYLALMGLFILGKGTSWGVPGLRFETRKY